MPAPVTIHVEGTRIALGNECIERTIDLAGGRLRTVLLANKLAGSTLTLRSEEFRLLTAEGCALNNESLDVEGWLEDVLPSGARRLTVRLGPGSAACAGRVEYWLAPGEFFLRKRVILTALGGPVQVESLDVERFTCRAAAGLGGRGQPLFLDDTYFLGLEYPGGFNALTDGVIALRHYPSSVPSGGELISKTAVLGAAPAEQAHSWFARYVARIRRRAPSFVSFNSGGDVQIYAPSATPDLAEPVEDCLARAAAAIKEQLYDKGGPAVRSVVLDAGWQDPETLYEVDRRKFPNGFGPLLGRLRAMDSNLGLWLSLSTPLSPVQLDRAFLESQGFGVEPGGRYPCISEPSYNRALRATIKKHIEEHGVVHFKFDFNTFVCASGAHGHRPDERHSFETNLDAQIEILRYAASLRDGLTIVPTCGMWLSSWWLMHADMIWPHGMWDFNYSRKPVALAPRDWAVTYRDQNLYELFRKERCQFPLSGITFCACLGGPRYNVAGPLERPRKFADAVVHAYARQLGLRRKELPSPLNRSQADWALLRATLRWALHRSELAAEGQMILGEPAAGQVYGYSHLGEAGGVLSLRNPSLREQRVVLPLDRLAPHSRCSIEVTYPYRRVLALAAGPDDEVALTVNPYEVVVVEASVGGDLNCPALADVRYSVVSDTPGELVCNVWTEPGNAAPLTVHAPSAIRRIEIDGDSVVANGGVVAECRLGPEGKAKPVRVKPLPRLKDRQGAWRNCVRLDVPDSVEARLVLVAQEDVARQPVFSVNMGGWFGGLPYSVAKGDGWMAYHLRLNPADLNAIAWRLGGGEDEDEPPAALFLFLARRLVCRQVCVHYEPRKRPANRPELPTPAAGVRSQVFLLHPLTTANGMVAGDEPIPWTDEFLAEFR